MNTERILKVIKSSEDKIATAKAKIEKDFNYAFEWGYPLNVYLEEYRKGKLEDFLKFLQQEQGREVEWLTNNIEYIERELLSGRYTQNSTNPFSNIAFAARKEVDAELLRFYKNLLKDVERN